jgi:hypothetical protein
MKYNMYSDERYTDDEASSYRSDEPQGDGFVPEEGFEDFSDGDGDGSFSSDDNDD